MEVPIHKPPFMFEVIDRVFIGQNIARFATTRKFRCFQPHAMLSYHGICKDFGPMSISSTIRFIEMLDHELDVYPSCKIAYCVDHGRREFTNAVFLLGCYLILCRNETADSTMAVFSWLQDSMVEAYRDATYSEPTFGLSMLDCWRGLDKAKLHRWVQEQTSQGIWGRIDIEEYIHFDNLLNADLHMVVPDKLIAFKGPLDPCGPTTPSCSGSWA